ncbi:MAG: hypothetical protein H0U66_03180 [Gemmatimonadaceae bacterium]|nr:hypothetical protein [Gemmatimonadaceae bacterium]
MMTLARYILPALGAWALALLLFYRAEWKKTQRGTFAMWLLLREKPNATGAEVSHAYYEAYHEGKAAFNRRLDASEARRRGTSPR